MDTISLTLRDHIRLHTCEPVSIRCKGAPLRAFQKRICLEQNKQPVYKEELRVCVNRESRECEKWKGE